MKNWFVFISLIKFINHILIKINQRMVKMRSIQANNCIEEYYNCCCWYCLMRRRFGRRLLWCRCKTFSIILYHRRWAKQSAIQNQCDTLGYSNIAPAKVSVVFIKFAILFHLSFKQERYWLQKYWTLSFSLESFRFWANEKESTQISILINTKVTNKWFWSSFNWFYQVRRCKCFKIHFN